MQLTGLNTIPCLDAKECYISVNHCYATVTFIKRFRVTAEFTELSLDVYTLEDYNVKMNSIYNIAWILPPYICQLSWHLVVYIDMLWVTGCSFNDFPLYIEMPEHTCDISDASVSTLAHYMENPSKGFLLHLDWRLVCVCLCVCGCVCDHTYSLLFLSPCLYRLVWHSAGVCVCLSRGPQSAGWCSDSHGFLESSVPRPLKMTSGCAPSQFARLFSKKHTYTHTKTHTHTWW